MCINTIYTTFKLIFQNETILEFFYAYEETAISLSFHPTYIKGNVMQLRKEF